MLIILILISILQIEGQAPTASCVANPPTPTGPCPIAIGAGIFRSGELSPLLTSDSEIWCSHPFQTQWGNFSNQVNFGVGQTSSDEIVWGTCTTTGASRLTGCTAENLNGLWNVMYSSTCASVSGSSCSYSSLYSGLLNCACTTQGNIAVTATPTSNLGYRRTSTPSSTSLDAFYPNVIGHWIFHFECTGSASAGQAYIELNDVTSGTKYRRALKDNGLATPMSITYVKTYNTISSTSGVNFLCQNCDLGSAAEPYCSFTAYRKG